MGQGKEEKRGHCPKLIIMSVQSRIIKKIQGDLFCLFH